MPMCSTIQVKEISANLMASNNDKLNKSQIELLGARLGFLECS